jgi:hypothetical protein
MRGRRHVLAQQVERRREALEIQPPGRVQRLIEALPRDEPAGGAAQRRMPQRRVAQPPRPGEPEKERPKNR